MDEQEMRRIIADAIRKVCDDRREKVWPDYLGESLTYDGSLHLLECVADEIFPKPVTAEQKPA